MLLLFAGITPFAGALMLRYGLCRTVAAAMTLLGLGPTARMVTLWHFEIAFGVLLGTAAGAVAMALPASIANRCSPCVAAWRWAFSPLPLPPAN